MFNPNSVPMFNPNSVPMFLFGQHVFICCFGSSTATVNKLLEAYLIVEFSVYLAGEIYEGRKEKSEQDQKEIIA